jgi:hypothetical protein
MSGPRKKAGFIMTIQRDAEEVNEIEDGAKDEMVGKVCILCLLHHIYS